MPQEQALHVLNGGLAPNPGDVAGLERRWASFRDRASARPEFETRSPIRKNIPAEVQSQLQEIASRPDLQATFAPHSWELGIVDLTVPILTYQSLVQVDSASERVGEAKSGGWDALMKICLPAIAETQVEGGFEPSQNAFTLSSLNPNLRVMSFEVLDAQTPGPPPSQKKVFGFTIGLGGSSVQFVEYQNRWMVRDGNHRLYGLLMAGISQVPAVLIHARSFEETGAGRPGFFGYEQLYGPRPPQLHDFLDNDLSADVAVRAVRKVVRIRAEEFVVLV
jgi:hypothetical protein